jgi:dipeptidase
MCDIIVSTPKVTRDHVMIFAKNSDRDPNEAQILEYIPKLKHESSEVKLTYIEYPQVKETYAILISRPWWIWGAEMGTNEFGLSIGNTAVFTKVRLPMKGLLGMDIIRLALERTKSSKEALNFIINTIETYGQGGNASYEHKMLYSNSFMIADPNEAWVLETAGKYWVAKKVKDFYTISNALTISDDWDLASDGVLRLAKKISSFSFAKYFSDKFYTYFAHGRERRVFTYNSIKNKEGDVTLEYIINLLRKHYKEPYKPWKGSMKDICMHFGGFTRPSQTASSQVSLLRNNNLSTHWFTGTSNPCLSIFKPIVIDDQLEKILKEIMGEIPNNTFNSRNYWWYVELLHRKLLLNYGDETRNFIKDLREMESKIIENIREHTNDTRYIIDTAREIFSKELELIHKWMSMSIKKQAPYLYSLIIKRENRRARLVF